MISGIGSHEDETARMQGFQFFVLKSKTRERLMVKIAKANREFALAEKINDTGGEK
ncbi:deoxyribonuclease [Candidatus Bathyarchaeota archaeon]|nr:deoxyribonuclease [Candidatus Bathyarchaeota archaeon]